MIRIEYTGTTGRIRQFRARPVTDAEGNVTAYQFSTGRKTAQVDASRVTIIEPKHNDQIRVALRGKVHATNGLRMTNLNDGSHILVPSCGTKPGHVYPHEVTANGFPVDCKRCLAKR